jgi:hypothetical protein
MLLPLSTRRPRDCECPFTTKEMFVLQLCAQTALSRESVRELQELRPETLEWLRLLHMTRKHGARDLRSAIFGQER